MKQLVLIVIAVVSTVLVAPLCAQVFPQEQELDVIDLKDGSVLIGRIVENETAGLTEERSSETPIRIEIAGGSQFVVDPVNIVRMRTIRNPEFGAEPQEFTVDSIAVLRAIYGEENYPLPEEETDQKEGLANATIVGIYFAPAVTWFGGGDWNAEQDSLDEVDQKMPDALDNVGISLQRFFHPYGFRITVGQIVRSGRYEGEIQDDNDNELGTVDRGESIRGPSVNTEFLIGGGDDRRRWYGGLGVGFLLVGTDEVIGDQNGVIPDELTKATMDEGPYNTVVFGTLSVGSVFALGDKWTGEVRVALDTSLTSIYPTRKVTANGISLGIGVGYRLR